MGKMTHVELEVNETRQKFEINHAERILRTPNNGGWKLPEDSEFTFDFNNGISYKRNTGKITDTNKKRGNKQSDNPSEQD